eukprot:scaffold633_cov321-Pavlova_lutheri.AAC.12
MDDRAPSTWIQWWRPGKIRNERGSNGAVRTGRWRTHCRALCRTHRDEVAPTATASTGRTGDPKPAHCAPVRRIRLPRMHDNPAQRGRSRNHPSRASRTAVLRSCPPAPPLRTDGVPQSRPGHGTGTGGVPICLHLHLWMVCRLPLPGHAEHRG